MILRVLFVGLALFAVDGMQHVSGGGTAARGCAARVPAPSVRQRLRVQKLVCVSHQLLDNPANEPDQSACTRAPLLNAVAGHEREREREREREIEREREREKKIEREMWRARERVR